MQDEKNKPGKIPEGKYMGTVKVGPKGQIIIPKEARDLFNIKPGDMLLLLADASQGIAVQTFDSYDDFFKQIFHAKEGPMIPEE